MIAPNGMSGFYKTLPKKIKLEILKEDMIEVYNEGNGIPDEDIASIWESFYQRVSGKGKREGSVGLGLYIVKDIVRQHGGTCGVRNEEAGVTFWIKI